MRTACPFSSDMHRVFMIESLAQLAEGVIPTSDSGALGGESR